MIEIVSWDVDGTLYDLDRMKRALGLATLRALAFGRRRRALREHQQLARFRAAMRRVRAAGGQLAPAALADRPRLLELERRWYGPAIARVGLRPGLAALLEELSARGVRQIAVSDYVADYKLAALGQASRFERVFAGEELGYLKPAPELFARVADALGIAPDRILHVGDLADRDGAAAAGAGCRSLLIDDCLAAPNRLLSQVRGGPASAGS